MLKATKIDENDLILKEGFVDMNGNWVIDPIYDETSNDTIKEFDVQDYCAVSINEKYGFIDRKGNWLIEPIFEYLGFFDSEGYCLAKLNGKMGFIDRVGSKTGSTRGGIHLLWLQALHIIIILIKVFFNKIISFFNKN